MHFNKNASDIIHVDYSSNSLMYTLGSPALKVVTTKKYLGVLTDYTFKPSY